MVSKRRYNSVERFASIHLSEFEQRQQLRPVEHLPIGTTTEAATSRVALPLPMSTAVMPSPSQHHQQMAHPFSLMRSRRSHEQLQSANPSAEKAQDFSPQALLLQRQVDGVPTTQNSLPTSSPPYSLQQYSQRHGQPLPTFAFSQLQFGRNPQQNQIDSLLSSPPPLQPLQIRSQQSPHDILSIQQHSSVPQEEDVDQQAISLLTNKIPTAFWATFSVLEVIAGIVSLFVGALNASPYNCMVEPNIPIYLILSGLFLIFNGAARIFFGLSASPTKQSKRRALSQIGFQRKSTTRSVLTYAFEGIGLLAILIVVILGSVWVYGASRYMHTQLYMFERHFCEHTLYWFAWWSVTIHLAMFALLILCGIIVLIYGAMPGRR